MQRPRRTPRHDSPLHSRWMSKRLREGVPHFSPEQPRAVLSAPQPQEGAERITGKIHQLPRAEQYYRGQTSRRVDKRKSPCSSLPGSGPTGAQQVPGNALRSQGSPGEQKVHAFNLGNNGSLISQVETEVAGCLLCGPQEGKVATSPFPHPCGCLSRTMNSNKRG